MERRQIWVCERQLSDLSTVVHDTSEEVRESCTSDGLQESQLWHGTDLDAQMEQLMRRMKAKREYFIGDDDDAASAEVYMSRQETVDLITPWEFFRLRTSSGDPEPRESRTPLQSPSREVERFQLSPNKRSLVSPQRILVENLQADFERLQAQIDEHQAQLEMLTISCQFSSDAQEASSCVTETVELEDEVRALRDCIEKCIAASEEAVSSLGPRMLNIAARSQESGMPVPAPSSVQRPIPRHKLNSVDELDTCALSPTTAVDQAQGGTQHQHEVPDASLVQQATSSDSLKLHDHPLEDYEKATWSDADGGVQHEDLKVCKEAVKLAVREAPPSCKVFPATLQSRPELGCFEGFSHMVESWLKQTR
ncbi:unnamed protein product [Polarella glacialis]|uniref:Uncharacterized protein n=1 Tax=Polarella glacialis TaxID=89957 RepID=A0A813IVY6_POLGL|nr:unnamed protein product [Polarella glacialis]